MINFINKFNISVFIIIILVVLLLLSIYFTIYLIAMFFMYQEKKNYDKTIDVSSRIITCFTFISVILFFMINSLKEISSATFEDIKYNLFLFTVSSLVLIPIYKLLFYISNKRSNNNKHDDEQNFHNE